MLLMKNKLFLSILIFVLFPLGVSLAGVTLLGAPEEDSFAPLQLVEAETVTPTSVEQASCSAITHRILDANSPSLDANELETADFDESDAEVRYYLVTYLIQDEALTEPYYYDDVSSNLLEEQGGTFLHQKIWNYFSALIPYKFRPHLTEFSIFTDGAGGALAAVAQTHTHMEQWGLEVDIADVNDYYTLSFNLIHEFAHLLTLSPSQVPPSLAIFNNPEDNQIYLKETSACSTFYPGEGCSNPNSYINQFYDRFWLDIYEEWNEINLEEDEDLYYEKLDNFYYQYKDQFLTDYAVTHPAEDIAESFAFFIFSQKPDGDTTIAEQKILFFYEYPELVEMRAEILNNLCVEFPQ